MNLTEISYAGAVLALAGVTIIISFSIAIWLLRRKLKSQDRAQFTERIREQYSEREPVWEAMSDLFLDTESNLEAVARRCAESKYSSEELKEILFLEVFPALRANLTTTGEWAGFDSLWLKKRILAKHSRGRWLQPWIFRSYTTTMWKSLEPMIRKFRS